MTDPRPPALAIFDLCETLYAENTTLGFVRFLQARHGGRAGRLALALAFSRRSPVFYLFAALYRLGAPDPFRWTLARLLRGRSRGELTAAARAYASERLPGLAIAQTQARLAEHRAAGDRVVLVSNSLDVVAEAAADRLGVDWRASRLGFRGARCTGRIEDDLSGRKAGVVAALIAGQSIRPVVHAYTDNLSDRDLVEMADRPTVIIPAGGSRARWRGVDAVFVEL
jgi:phosphoserine phosphatase